MKYSLKNKEFSRKKHNIFDNNLRKSRSRSTSLTPKKSIQNSNDNIQKQYTIQVNPPSLDHSAIDKLNSFDSRNNSMHVQKNQSQQSMFQSFSRVQNPAYNSKRPFMTTNSNSIKPSQPVKFILPPKTNSDFRQKIVTENSEPRSESFQVCEDDNSSRVNRFFAQSILAKESQSPHTKVIFEPVVRKSLSPDPRSLSPDPKFQAQFNRVTPINLKIQPQTKVIYHPHENIPIERKVSIVQIPRQIVKIESHRIQNPQFIQYNNLIAQNQHQGQEITDLKRKIDQQNLQIQYLKNQKEILQSNIELQFSPKKGAFQSTRIQQQDMHRIVTPQKYGIQPSPQVINQQLDRNKLIQLAQILKNNQAKLMYLQRKYQSFYSQLFSKFNQSLFNCQNLLVKMFTQKYQAFSEQLNAKLFLIDKKTTQVLALDHKVDIFTNTFRSIQQNLRITKLKQQNIQLLIENKHRQTDRFWSKEEGSRLLLMENQSDISSIRIFNDNQMEEKDRQQLKKLQKNLKQKNSTSQWNQNNKQQQFQEFDSFLDDKYSHLVYNRKKQKSNPKSRDQSSNQKHRKSHHFRQKEKSNPKKQFIVSQIYDESQNKKYSNNKSTTQEIQQFSPFQANQMFINQRKATSPNGNFSKFSQFTPSHDFTSSNNKRQSFNFKSEKNKMNLSLDNSSSKNYDFSQNSFEVEMNYKQTPRNQLQKQISFTSQNMFKKPPNKTISENDDISDTLQGEQERLVKILKTKNYQFPVDCWLDELGCLRKKNQTYIFDEQGSVIMTTSAAFKKLKQKNFFS